MADKRLIDANALKEAFENDWHLTEYIDLMVDQVPTIDAVEVVRCRECAYYNRALQLCNNGLGMRLHEFYCADGAKMDGGAEG